MKLNYCVVFFLHLDKNQTNFKKKYFLISFRIFPTGNVLHFEYVNSEADGDAVLIHDDCREEFKFVAGQKLVQVLTSLPLSFKSYLEDNFKMKGEHNFLITFYF